MNLIIALLGFGFLVLMHELGHFFLARINGVKVEEFSIGMGPTLISKQGKGTKWSLKAFPIGGACQMKGEATGQDDKDGDSFQSKSSLAKISIIAAGPLMNILIAIILFTGYGSINGYTTNRIKEIFPDTPAMAAGLQAGDEIIKVGNYTSGNFVDVKTGIYFAGENPTVFKIKRGGEIKEFTITPKPDKETGQFIIGFRTEKIEKPGIFESLSLGTKEMLSISKQTVYAMKGLISGKLGGESVTGPLGVIGTAKEAASMGITPFLKFVGLLSISLAVFNLIPFPALDGGWIFLLLIELIRGKKIPEKYVAAWNLTGMTFLILLMIIVSVKDVLSLLK